MKLYHGSNIEINTPDLTKSKPYKDFGKGFYLSANKEQAIRMAAANPAVIMRQEHLGLIAPGYDADLVVFDKKFNTLDIININFIDLSFMNFYHLMLFVSYFNFIIDVLFLKHINQFIF